MTKEKLNKLPELVSTGKISIRDAINKVGEFVYENSKMFGLQKYDEDFRSEIYATLLERGERIFELYNFRFSTFSTYIFINVDSLIKSRIKNIVKNNTLDDFDYNESITEYEEKSEHYIPFVTNNVLHTEKQVKHKLSNIKDLFSNRKIISTNQKTLIILVLRSAYYISDFHIKTICKYINFEEEVFSDIIQKLRENINNSEKIVHRRTILERRNVSYVYHKRYDAQLAKIEEFSEKPKNYELDLSSKKDKYTNKWEKLNKKFSEGFMYLRPNSKEIAEVVGLSSRQVDYYIEKAQNLDKDFIKQVMDFSINC